MAGESEPNDTPPVGESPRWSPTNPQPGAFAPPGYRPPVPGDPGGDPVNVTLPVVLGFVASLCACLPGGMTAIAFAMLAKDQETRGDVEGAHKKITISYAISIGSLVIGLPFVLLYLWLQMQRF